MYPFRTTFCAKAQTLRKPTSCEFANFSCEKGTFSLRRLVRKGSLRSLKETFAITICPLKLFYVWMFAWKLLRRNQIFSLHPLYPSFWSPNLQTFMKLGLKLTFVSQQTLPYIPRTLLLPWKSFHEWYKHMVCSLHKCSFEVINVVAKPWVTCSSQTFLFLHPFPITLWREMLFFL